MYDIIHNVIRFKRVIIIRKECKKYDKVNDQSKKKQLFCFRLISSKTLLTGEISLTLL